MRKLLLIIIFCNISLTTFSQQNSFIVDIITNDTLFDTSGRGSIAVDQDNNIHVCWYSNLDPYRSRILYSKRDCGTGLWSPPEIVSDTMVKSRYPCIALEKNTGILHISYIAYMDTFNVYSSEIVHAYKQPLNEWETEYITNDTLYSLKSSIAIDDYNNCHIIWTSSNESLSRVFYSNNINSTWESQILTDSNFYYSIWTEFSPSIAVSSEGVAYIAFIAKINETYAYTRLATNNYPNGTNWIYEMIETPENNDFSVQIALQSDSILHTLISGNEGLYNGPNNSYYTFKEISGLSSPLEYVNSTGGIKSMVIDNNGKIHALQIPGGGGVLGFGMLSYTSNITGIWIDTLVSSMISEPFESFAGASIGIGKYGNICICATNTKYFESKEIIVLRYDNHCDTSNIVLESLSKREVIIYPNPCINTSIFEFDNPDNKKHTLHFFNSKGQFISKIDNINSNQIIIDGSHMNSGLYFYMLMKENNLISTGKLLVK